MGTFKVNPHGTRLGERFIKKIFDGALVRNVDAAYVTVFPKHKKLIDLLQRYGFEKVGTKASKNGTEDVLIKDMRGFRADVIKDYPLITDNGNKKYILAIRPEYHTPLFPDSKLYGETYDLIKDVSYTNSIHKIYICNMQGVASLNRGDLLVIYRTTDIEGQAEYRAVVTSVCCVEDVKTRNNFSTAEEFVTYCKSYSVFTDEDLTKWYNSFKNLTLIKMTYNIALKKRLIRKTLIENVGLSRDEYWGFFEISDEQFKNIIRLGEVDESVIVN